MNKVTDLITNVFVELKQYDRGDIEEAAVVCDLLGQDTKIINEWIKECKPLYDLINSLEYSEFMGDDNVFDIESYDKYRVDAMAEFNRVMCKKYPVESKEIINKESQEININHERALTLFK